MTLADRLTAAQSRAAGVQAESEKTQAEYDGRIKALITERDQRLNDLAQEFYRTEGEIRALAPLAAEEAATPNRAARRATRTSAPPKP